MMQDDVKPKRVVKVKGPCTQKRPRPADVHVVIQPSGNAAAALNPEEETEVPLSQLFSSLAKK